MRILLPTGTATYAVVKKAASGIDAEVVVTGEIASFLSPGRLTEIVRKGKYDMVIVSGMSTASFEDVEKETGVPVYRGPRHAADLTLVLPLIGTITLSKTIPADDLLTDIRRREARLKVYEEERRAGFQYLIRSVKIGGGSRIKVLAEIMDAHKEPDLADRVGSYFAAGADIVDLGFGFDATPQEVTHCFSLLNDIEGPLAVDSQDPYLIRAALCRADIVLSLQEENIPVVGRDVAGSGACAVVVPGRSSLEKNIERAESAGITCIIADPLLRPAGSGVVKSMSSFPECAYPLFFGAGNVVELLDADSPGANALLAACAAELDCAVIFTSEHSDKTSGSVGEMRRATEMMVLAGNRPYPKDLGIDLFVIKEKRRRREPPVTYTDVLDAEPVPDEIIYDPCGNFRIGLEGDRIIAEIRGKAVRGRSWDDIFYTILSEGGVSRLDHAAYLGKELYKAELALKFGRSFEQDGPF